MPASDLALLVEAAEAAGRIAARYWRARPKQWEKGEGAGPVTEADLAIDRMLRERLTKARPGYGWLSEETEDHPARLSAERAFIVDPIDGTRAFIAGEPTWAHSLAVIEDGRPIAGVVHLPVREKTYAAALHAGATLNGAAIRASARREVAGAIFLAHRASFDARHWRGAVPKVDRAFRPSLAYRLCLVAEGRFDGMLTLRPTWEWDIAAGALVATEAGALVTTRRGAALAFNNPDPRVDGVLAAGRALHPEIVGQMA